ncbi:hypothetical protein GCM10010967_55300 [Dyadobacter beijingensis]|uniref:Secreted protein (Por secretion system target) n=1 Tax=Dyadobacter beijingensis TaxID=365489 RepID=A0ABQ2II62_9BACT|nr:S8 family serine peptidase [Dyadobacter beijingensis]GGN12233.1 hypothetical protein GCM10010967_55300 [Dyadobacter beijingensis]
MASIKQTTSLLLLLFLLSLQSIAQRQSGHRLFLKNRVLALPDSVPDDVPQGYGRPSQGQMGKSLVVIQFRQLPDEATLAAMKAQGIEILDYIPDFAYTATLAGRVNGKSLKKLGVRAIYRPTPEDVVEPALLAGTVPDHARNVAGKIDLKLNFAKSFSFDEVLRDLTQNSFEVLYEALKPYQILDVRIPEGSVRRLAELPWVQYIAPIAPPSDMLNDKSTASTRANVLGSTAILGYKLTGEGVVIGLGDDFTPLVHPDVGKRVISYVPMHESWHGIHVGGTAAGSGLLNEKYRGYAPKAKIVARSREAIWTAPASLIRDYGMVVTSNTYGGYTLCGSFGMYYDGAAALDQQAFEFPYLQHVFSAGNSGTETNCQDAGYPVGFGTVAGDCQSAKNIITVGRTTSTGIVSPASSKGPTSDGRIKPEVIAPGGSIFSTIQNNAYQTASGTSMASPAVTGGAALLVERYRQLHQRNNPKNALLKALICNGATDMGLPGPDFSHGFGIMNLLRSVSMLDKGRYFSGQLSRSATNTHEIVVPANTAKLKVMLYWNDPATSLLAGGKTLVNNLDLTVTRPGNSKVLPKFPSAAAPNAPAVSGVDTLNNIEQIVIEEPAAGTYSVKVEAAHIPQGVQEYFVVYDIIEPSVTVTYPLAGDRLAKGDAVNICWDSYGDTLSTFHVAYSLDNGGSWNAINANVSAELRQIPWTVPDGASGNAKVRVMRNGTAFSNTSGTFAVLGVPVVSLQAVQCEGYVALQWNAVSGASDYEVMLSSGDEMRSVGLTSALKYTLSSLSRDSTYYISVRARKDQVPGRRSVALMRKPDNGSCQGNISDNDLAIVALVSPASNVRMFTRSAYTAEHAITVRIKNLDDQPQTRPFEVGYSLGGVMHWEQVTMTIPATSSADYTFQRRENLALVTEATLRVAVRLPGDPIQGNDALEMKLRQIPNPKLVLPYLQDFEALPALDIREPAMGIPGADAFDFMPTSEHFRLRSGAGYSSANAFVFDAISPYAWVPSTGDLDGTFNLSGYRAREDEIWFSVRHTNSNALQIRGSAGDPWITVDNLYGGYFDNDRGYSLAVVEVSSLLLNNGQEFTADFQVRLSNSVLNSNQPNGVAVDEVRLFKAASDVATTRLNAVSSISICDFNNASIKAAFRNNGSHDSYKLPIKLSLDGQVTERNIDVVRKDGEVEFEFYYPLEARQPGRHVLKVWCEKAFDINRSNDTMTVEFYTSGSIPTLPYLENFESGNNGWYSEGTSSTWQLGTPSSAGVSGAASGHNAWKTNLTGRYNNNEASYLYSPCFYNESPFNKYLSFVAKMDMEDCAGEGCDKFYIEYFDGYNWYRLGGKDYGYNWYNNERDYQGFWAGKVATGWRVFSVPLPVSLYLRLRFVFKSNGSGSSEGITIDDIHIYSGAGYEIYGGGSLQDEHSATITPDHDWNHFAPNNTVIGSIHGHEQNISGTTLKTFVNNGPLRVSENELVLDRSFVFNSPQTFDNPVGVRLYVPETDIQRLVNAPPQSNVTKPGSAYDLAVTKYSGPNQDGLLTNNARTNWEYFAPEKVKKVPYLNGYYLEFETKSFSEFWVARDYIGTGTPLPVTLIGFTAEKGMSGENTVVHLKWSTTSETDFSHFTVQVAEGPENVKKALFYDLGTIQGQGGNGTRPYSFTDGPLRPHGTRYYRLKMVDSDGSVAYSSIRSVAFVQDPQWQVFPNPSKGIFRIDTGNMLNGPVQVKVFDLNGKLCKKLEFKQMTNGLEVDLSSPDLALGLYLIKVSSKEREQQFKVVKE